MVAFFAGIEPVEIAIEACGASHHWARLLQSFSHEVKLIAPQLVKPYVRRGKNDAADAEALCEAMSRPTMRFVPVKTAEQQAGLMLMGVTDRLIRNRCNLTNAIRSFAAEFGLTASTGDYHIPSLLTRTAADGDLPLLARELFTVQAAEYDRLRAQIAEMDEKLQAWHRASECSRRLAQIPGVGPIGAAMLIMKTPAPEAFQSGRQFAAWLGLTPKDHSTGGKVRLGTITRAGDEGLRRVLVVVLSDECGGPSWALLASGDDPQIKSQAAIPVPLFPLVAGRNPAGGHDVCAFPAVAAKGSVSPMWHRVAGDARRRACPANPEQNHPVPSVVSSPHPR